MERKLILHLWADTGSDSRPYQNDPAYEVRCIGADIGVQNFSALGLKVHGIIANPICTELTPAKYGRQFGGGERPRRNMADARWALDHTLRIIEEADPVWWAIENPAAGMMRELMGKPDFSYEPWQFGSPWTKRTGLWGVFNAPVPRYTRWEDVPKNEALYIRPGRTKPSLAFAHKSAWHRIPEFRDSGMPEPTSDMELRSLCSQKFAAAFKEMNP